MSHPLKNEVLKIQKRNILAKIWYHKISHALTKKMRLQIRKLWAFEVLQ